jgi:predicted RNA-binding protein with RPS1 domain
MDRPRHQHHRLRRLRGAGAGRRGPRPRLRDELDQEERASGQDRLHLPGGRGDGARRRSAPSAASRSASSSACSNPWERSPRSIRRQRGRGRGQEHHRVRPVHRPRRRHRRHGPPLRSRLEPSGEEAIQDYKKGDMVKAVVLDVDVEKERISLGIKQLGGDPFAAAAAAQAGRRRHRHRHRDRGWRRRGGVEGMKAFIRRSDLARDRPTSAPSASPSATSVDARVTNIDKRSRRLSLSIKAREIAEEKEAVAQYGSSDSGASLGDILGAALKERRAASKRHRMSEARRSTERRPAAPLHLSARRLLAADPGHRGRGRRGGSVVLARRRRATLCRPLRRGRRHLRRPGARRAAARDRRRRSTPAPSSCESTAPAAPPPAPRRSTKRCAPSPLQARRRGDGRGRGLGRLHRRHRRGPRLRPRGNTLTGSIGVFAAIPTSRACWRASASRSTEERSDEFKAQPLLVWTARRRRSTPGTRRC